MPTFALLSLAALAAVSSTAHAHGGAEYSLSERWATDTTIPSSHPVYRIFKRQKASANYPTADVQGPVPQAPWMQAYQAAKAANLIPNFPVATFVQGQLPQYPASANPDSPDPDGLCSYSSAVCNATDDIIDAPSGHVALSFDDGPQPASTALLSFLKSHKLHALHFNIGSRILDNPDIFDDTVSNGDPIACHTWSHPYMTTLNDTAVVGELGWTLQIIYDKTGRLPAFWRPPYGDVDNRVRAIAKEVFGLKTVIWNQDTRDWCLSDLTPGKSACSPGDGPQTYSNLIGELTAFYDLSHSPGLVVLEHEHVTRGVQAFIQTYPLIAQNKWTVCALPDCLNQPWYQNADTDSDKAKSLGTYGVANAGGVGAANGTSTTGSTSTSGGTKASGRASASSSPSRIASALPSASAAPSVVAAVSNSTTSNKSAAAPNAKPGALELVGLTVLAGAVAALR